MNLIMKVLWKMLAQKEPKMVWAWTTPLTSVRWEGATPSKQNRALMRAALPASIQAAPQLWHNALNLNTAWEAVTTGQWLRAEACLPTTWATRWLPIAWACLTTASTKSTPPSSLPLATSLKCVTSWLATRWVPTTWTRAWRKDRRLEHRMLSVRNLTASCPTITSTISSIEGPAKVKWTPLLGACSQHQGGLRHSAPLTTSLFQ